MDKKKLVCPKCNQEFEFEEAEKPSAPGTSGDEEIQKHDAECDLDDPEKKGYCCPMCGYADPDPAAFVPLS